MMCLLGLLVLSACTSSSAPDDRPVMLTVYAASSLTEAFNDIEAEFEDRYTNIDVVMNYASSSQLATQINEGAPADVFASANFAQMEVVQEAGNLTSLPVIFATNQLV